MEADTHMAQRNSDMYLASVDAVHCSMAAEAVGGTNQGAVVAGIVAANRADQTKLYRLNTDFALYHSLVDLQALIPHPRRLNRFLHHCSKLVN